MRVACIAVTAIAVPPIGMRNQRMRCAPVSSNGSPHRMADPRSLRWPAAPNPAIAAAHRNPGFGPNHGATRQRQGIWRANRQRPRDHAADGDFVRADLGSRSVVLVRESADQIHALRNSCLHAGYRVCEAEAGNATHLYCVYHGWSYALDGRLTDPMMQPKITDRSRFRLARYAMQIQRGLILVDPSSVAPEPPAAGSIPSPTRCARPATASPRRRSTANSTAGTGR